MLTYADISPKNKAFIFELDDVLYPEKDYLLQVYYLFSNFIEYSEGFPKADELSAFFKKSFEFHGAAGIFEKVQEAFGLDAKYRGNFERLHSTARLPLKLLLFQNMLSLMQEMVVDRKNLFIVTNGDPEQQLNKIRQMEWNGLENYLRVFFANETNAKPETTVLNDLLGDYNLLRKDLAIIGNSKTDEEFARNAGIDYIQSIDFT
jgi:FMN phosphatase YigB (HAD superfamily)